MLKLKKKQNAVVEKKPLGKKFEMIRDLQIVYHKVGDLKVDPRNTRTHSCAAEERSR